MMVLKETQESTTEIDSSYVQGFPINEKFLYNELEIEKELFSNKKLELLQNPDFVGKYVAVLNGEVIDYDSDEHELLKRVYESKGYVPILVEKISSDELEYTTSPNFDL